MLRSIPCMGGGRVQRLCPPHGSALATRRQPCAFATRRVCARARLAVAFGDAPGVGGGRNVAEHGAPREGPSVRAIAWAWISAAVIAGCGGPAEPPRDLVFVSLDTVRRDHASLYGYARETTPALAALGGRSAVFDAAFAQETNTNPSHASMFTGLYPHVHGATNNGVLLPPGVTTLAEILRGAGFRTGGFVSGAAMAARTTGLERGFETYDDEFTGIRRDGAETTRRALEWLRARTPGERAFLFVHLYDPHGPYLPVGPYTELFADGDPGPALERIPEYQRVLDPAGQLVTALGDYVRRYDAMIRYADDRLAELLAAVDLERSVVVVLSDHGESLGERYHPLDHGGHVTDEQIRIPLVIHVPGAAPARIAAPVETVDLLPTLLELLDVALPPGQPVQGRSVAPLVLGDAPRSAERDLVFSSSRALSDRYADRGYALDPARRSHAARSSRWKLVWYPGTQGDYLELYDLAADPGETTNVADAHPRVRDAFAEALRAWLGESGAQAAPAIDPDLREKLRQLGYAD
jgi:arylsulfatase A-like enzyme